MKKGTLWNWHNQIESWRQQGSVLAELLKGRINDFYKEHGVRINTLIEDIVKLQKKYYVWENEQIKLDEKKQPIFVEGKTMEDLNKEFQELMMQDLSTLQVIKHG